MLNMIRMELYRMFKTKSLYVIWLVLAAGILFTTGLSADEKKSRKCMNMRQGSRKATLSILEWT